MSTPDPSTREAEMNISGITINGESEPVIGPGLILERGRERCVVADKGSNSGYELPKLWIAWQYQNWRGRWSRPTGEGNHQLVTRAYIAALLISGFKVIREADTKAGG